MSCTYGFSTGICLNWQSWLSERKLLAGEAISLGVRFYKFLKNSLVLYLLVVADRKSSS